MRLLRVVPINRGCFLLACWCMAILSCGGSSTTPATSVIELTASGVTLVSQELQCEITARAVDNRGDPVSGVEIGLSSSVTSVILEPSSGTSDAEGRVVFVATTTVGGPVSFQGSLVTDGLDLGDPEEVTFGLELSLSASEPELTYPGARVELLASVSDAEGPVEGVELELHAQRPDDTVSPESQDSDGDGQALFEVTTLQSGEARLGLVVPGLDLPDLPSLAVNFQAAVLSGTWTHEQPGAIIVAPRVGAIWLDMHADLGTVPPARELASVALDTVPTLGDSGTFALALPLDPPDGDFYSPDPLNPELPETFEIAPYGIGMYDDRDQSGDLTDGDTLIAMTESRDVLTCVRGELPGPPVDMPNLTVGYQFLDSLHGDPPVVIPLEDLADQQDLIIRMAACPEVDLHGQIVADVATPDGLDLRLALIMLDANLFLAGNLGEMFHQGNFLVLKDQVLEYSPGFDTDYTMALVSPGDQPIDYQDLLVTAPGMMRLGMIMPIAYLDADGNDEYTNEDNDIATGDIVAGSVELPFGLAYFLLEWVDQPIAPMFAFNLVGANEGYNLVREPTKIAVAEVIDDNTLKLARTFEGGHENLPFRIQHPGSYVPEVVMEGEDLYTGAGAVSEEVTSAQGGFLGVVDPAQDVLVFTNEAERTEILDLDTPVRIGLR